MKPDQQKSELFTQFKDLFEKERQNLVYSHSLINQDFHIKPEDLTDEVDITSSELETSMRMRLRNREALYIKKLDQALERIARGNFGECQECGDDIEVKRLQARPTATMCVNCKEEQERHELMHADGLKPKSLGQRLKLA